MTKGTTSMGNFTRKKTHIRCRRCGNNSFHRRHKTCAKCGYPDPKMRKYTWIKRRVV
jgi:large subunit ribosomal protein L37e